VKVHAEQLFRGLLWRLKVQPLATSVAALVDEVLRRAHTQPTGAAVLQIVYQRTRGEVLTQLIARAGPRRQRILETMIPVLPPPLSSDFHCDAGLGGLARWLRAAGYDAAFWRDIDDDELLRKMTNSGAILLTSDRRLMDRGVITTGAIAALLVPISLKKREQFAFVRNQLELPLREPRCMACGGRLVAVEKEAVRDRIPPRTYPWRDDYYVCQRCNRLFWQGTHWERIEAALGTSLASRIE
jgi:uncharacterized protein